ncbi:MAG: AGE family epimerase/isomerase [Bacteroidia bacterium]
MKKDFRLLAEQYRKTLLEDVIPFWTENSIDNEKGGYFTCLDQHGNVYDTDKFIWLQARQVWTFSSLYNHIEPNQEWLDIARNGAEFLREKGKNPKGEFYFSLDQSGAPLIEAYNIFSDCFAVIAFYQYGLASRDDSYLKEAESSFRQILKRKDNPKGKYEKSTGNRPIKGFALPMIIANLLLDIDGLLPAEEVADIVDLCVHEVMEVFYNPDNGLIHEYVSAEGKFIDTFEGRLINPGHGIEAMWFIMDLAIKKGDQQLLSISVDRTLDLLRFGWDDEYGGIFYFLDAKGAPPQQLEWDQKLWWVHLETLVALAKAYRYTKREDVWEAFQKVHKYTWSHFPDPKNGEWFGYLNRKGEVLLSLKGGKWKACYHLPRALFECWQTFDFLAQETEQ